MNRISPASAVSSNAIVAKVVVDLKRTANPETEMIFGIIMFEDIFLAVYLTLVSGLVLSGATSFGQAATSAVIALGYMLAVLAVGRKATSWLNRALDICSDEVFLLIIFATLLLVAGISETIHVAEAIGALLVGLVLAETEHRQRIEHRTHDSLPWRIFHYHGQFSPEWQFTSYPATMCCALCAHLSHFRTMAHHAITVHVRNAQQGAPLAQAIGRQGKSPTRGRCAVGTGAELKRGYGFDRPRPSTKEKG